MNSQGGYEIMVEGHLDERWSELFTGLASANEKNGTARILLPTTDQAALHGLLARIRDLNLPLLSVTLLPAATRER